MTWFPSSGGHPEWHFQQNVLNVINGGWLTLQNGEKVFIEKWDIMIGHPTCKYLANSGAQWYYHPEDKHIKDTSLRRPHPLYPNRRQDQKDGIEFFKLLWEAPIAKIALENPVPLRELTHVVGKYHQVVQPWMFGDSFQKTTCLWLKGLPQLVPTNIVDRGEFITYPSGKKLAKWYSEAKVASKEKTQKVRSKTFPGFARAMAAQWAGGKLIENQLQLL